VSLGLLAALILSTLPDQRETPTDAAPVSTTSIMPLIRERCANCHSSTPSLAGMSQPPLGLAFDNPGQVEAQAQRIFESAVNSRTMPLGNLTGMTDDERAILAQWYAGLATVATASNP
jgi:uncharacterized membrane protein